MTQIKENLKAPRDWPLWGESPVTGKFPAQRTSNAENVSIWWRHQVTIEKTSKLRITDHASGKFIGALWIYRISNRESVSILWRHHYPSCRANVETQVFRVAQVPRVPQGEVVALRVWRGLLAHLDGAGFLGIREPLDLPEGTPRRLPDSLCSKVSDGGTPTTPRWKSVWQSRKVRFNDFRWAGCWCQSNSGHVISGWS